MLAAGFDINHQNSDDVTFLQILCLSAQVSKTRVQYLLQKRPHISENDLSQLIAKAAISKQRAHPATKQAIDQVKAFVSAHAPPAK